MASVLISYELEDKDESKNSLLETAMCNPPYNFDKSYSHASGRKDLPKFSLCHEHKDDVTALKDLKSCAATLGIEIKNAVAIKDSSSHWSHS